MSRKSISISRRWSLKNIRTALSLVNRSPWLSCGCTGTKMKRRKFISSNTRPRTSLLSCKKSRTESRPLKTALGLFHLETYLDSATYWSISTSTRWRQIKECSLMMRKATSEGENRRSTSAVKSPSSSHSISAT